MTTPLMPREWKSALETFTRRKGRSRNWDAYNTVAAAILEQLRAIDSVDELKRRYRRDQYRALQMARRLFPDDPAAWNLHLTNDVAYGWRFLELTGLQAHEARADREATAAELAAEAADEAQEAGGAPPTAPAAVPPPEAGRDTSAG